jgi:hypothetical protein
MAMIAAETAGVQSTLEDNRRAVSAFITAAQAVPQSAWSTPRAPGKWSPAQVTEHVAIAYEVSRSILNGQYTGGAPPRVLRPIIRTLFLRPVLKSGRFTRRGRAPAAFEPSTSPGNVADVTARVNNAAGAFQRDVAAAAAAGRGVLDHPFFGRIALADYARLQAIHTRHHAQQLGPEPVR